MNECSVPKWSLRNQRQELIREEEEVEESNRSFHMHTPLPQNPTASKLVPMSNYEVAELTWENGQLGMHALSGLLHSGSGQTKSLWKNTGTSETLESIVRQATCQNSSGGKWAEASSSGHHLLMKKRSRSVQSNQCATSGNGSIHRDEAIDPSACGSARENTMDIIWDSFESPPSSKPKTTLEDSASHGGSENQDEDRETKAQTLRSHSSRRIRAAAVHNLSERRRRDRINQKMKALQKLVPNASKTDKASMLDEVIEYLKQLQAQLLAMSAREMPQMMMSLGMQHQLQMSLLTHMGMGMGMVDFNSFPNTTPRSLPHLLHPTLPAPAASSTTFSTTPTFVPHPFLVPSLISAHASAPANQSMNMEAYNKMAAFYLQQVNQTSQAASNLSQLSRVQGDN